MLRSKVLNDRKDLLARLDKILTQLVERQSHDVFGKKVVFLVAFSNASRHTLVSVLLPSLPQFESYEFLIS